MKKIIILGSVVFLMTGCSQQINNSDTVADQAENQIVALQPISEDEPIVVTDSGIATAGSQLTDPAGGMAKSKWTELTHRNVASIAAAQWGLSAARAALIADGSDDPDTYQAGIEHGYQQQWDHAYIYDCLFGSTYYLWGGADVDFHDNILGPIGGDGYNGLYAGYYYNAGNQQTGDKYLGCAIHYIEDVSLTLHSTAPTSLGITVSYYTVDMATHHSDFENWVQNNLTNGWKLLDAVTSDYYYYPITDTKQTVKNAAWASCSYRGTASVGYSAWKAYRDCGYPTAAGTGNATLVANTKTMLIAAGRYAKGAIKFTLDNYGQWTSRY